MKILVGLGTPGSGYRFTRHNVGFLVVEEMRSRLGDPPLERAGRSLLCRARLDGHPVLLARPQTYMNRSGDAVSALLIVGQGEPIDLLVICDDLNLNLGTIRLRPRGRHGGHNGLRSIIETLGTDEFARLRIGIGPPDEGLDHADFVLEPFPRADRDKLEEVVQRAADCVQAAAIEGVEQSMNRFNRRQASGTTA